VTTWFANGDISFTDGSNGDNWFWKEDTKEFTYHMEATDTDCWSNSYDAYVTTSDGNKIYYNKANDEWLYTDSNDINVYYYPEWAWGTVDHEWYLWNDYHDNFFNWL